jgi:hypothetical protein
MRQGGLWICLVFVALSNSPIVFAATDARLEDQRQAFRDVYPDAERGNWAPVAAKESLLVDYVLWPDLRAVYLRTRLGKSDNAEIRAFLPDTAR